MILIPRLAARLRLAWFRRLHGSEQNRAGALARKTFPHSEQVAPCHVMVPVVPAAETIRRLTQAAAHRWRFRHRR